MYYYTIGITKASASSADMELGEVFDFLESELPGPLTSVTIYEEELYWRVVGVSASSTVARTSD